MVSLDVTSQPNKMFIIDLKEKKKVLNFNMKYVTACAKLKKKSPLEVLARRPWLLISNFCFNLPEVKIQDETGEQKQRFVINAVDIVPTTTGRSIYQHPNKT